MSWVCACVVRVESTKQDFTMSPVDESCYESDLSLSIEVPVIGICELSRSQGGDSV